MWTLPDVVHLGGQEEGSGTLDHLLHLRAVHSGRESGQPLGVVEQSLQPELLGRSGEHVHNPLQGRGHAHQAGV